MTHALDRVRDAAVRGPYPPAPSPATELATAVVMRRAVPSLPNGGHVRVRRPWRPRAPALRRAAGFGRSPDAKHPAIARPAFARPAHAGIRGPAVGLTSPASTVPPTVVRAALPPVAAGAPSAPQQEASRSTDAHAPHGLD